MAFAVWKGVWVRRPALLLAGCLWCLLAINAAPAAASSTQQLLVEDEHHLLERSPAEQARMLEMLSDLGADKIRSVVWWRFLLADPKAGSKPAGNAADSRSPIYSRSRFSKLDSLVRGARQRQIALQLDPASASGLEGTRLHLPSWAQLPSGAPRVREFALFVTALARRYGGAFVPPGDNRPLPRVREWSIWNEPNSPDFLKPKWRTVGGETVAWSPVLYRSIYTAAVGALRRNGHRDSRIYFGETASTGLAIPFPAGPIAPGTFVRELACLDRELRPYTGEEARRRQCQGYRRLDTDGLATHFYPGAGDAVPIRLDPDLSLWTPGDPARPAALLGDLAARGRLPAGLPVYNTEAGYQYHPIRRPLLTADAQARAINLAEYLQWREPSVASFAQYLVYDDPGWFTGLRYIDGPAKPAFFALRMPIVARAVNGGIEVWGAAYGRHAGRITQILVNGLPLGIANPSNPRGYYQVNVLGGPGSLVQAVDPLTGYRSRIAIATPGL